MIKTITLVGLLLMMFTKSYSQADSMKAGYQRFPTVPPFTLLKSDSSTFSRKDLKKNKKTMIMYFSPTCDHCRHQTDSILAHMKNLKDVQIVMATYQPLNEMKSFYDEFRLANYKNVTIGRDSKYFFQPFYRIANYPYLALYNQQSRLITTFEGTTDMRKIINAFR